jgi:hypothetical protein
MDTDGHEEQELAALAAAQDGHNGGGPADPLPPEELEWVTIKTAAHLSGQSERTIRRRIMDGSLESRLVLVGKKPLRLVRRSALPIPHEEAAGVAHHAELLPAPASPEGHTLAHLLEALMASQESREAVLARLVAVDEREAETLARLVESQELLCRELQGIRQALEDHGRRQEEARRRPWWRRLFGVR